MRSSGESRTGSVKGFEPARASKEKGERSGQAYPPATVVVAGGSSEEDPFVVKLDPSDPGHPKVRAVFRGRPRSADHCGK